jgi:hypothetical protein
VTQEAGSPNDDRFAVERAQHANPPCTITDYSLFCYCLGQPSQMHMLQCEEKLSRKPVIMILTKPAETAF